MKEENIKNQKSIYFVWGLIGILTVSAFIPAKWLGVKPQTPNRLDLQALNDISKLALDSNNNNNPDWRDLLNEIGGIPTSIGTVDIDVQKRLDDPNNLTASFSKNLYFTSAYLNKNNITNSEDKQQIIESIIAEEGSKIVAKEYAVGDLKIAKTESSSSIRKYGNDLGVILNKAVQYKLIDGDLEIIQSFATNKDASVLSSLKIKKDRASELLQQLLAMNIPESSSIYHLLVINKLSDYITTLDNMSRADVDPMRATISFKQYVSVINSLVISIYNFVSYFNTSNVVFTSKESGYMFSSGYTRNN